MGYHKNNITHQFSKLCFNSSMSKSPAGWRVDSVCQGSQKVKVPDDTEMKVKIFLLVHEPQLTLRNSPPESSSSECREQTVSYRSFNLFKSVNCLFKPLSDTPLPLASVACVKTSPSAHLCLNMSCLYLHSSSTHADQSKADIVTAHHSHSLLSSPSHLPQAPTKGFSR